MQGSAGSLAFWTPQGGLLIQKAGGLSLAPEGLGWSFPPFSPPTARLTFVFEVLQDGDYGLQGDVVGQEELPGTVLLKGLPVQALDCRGQRRGLLVRSFTYT